MRAALLTTVILILPLSAVSQEADQSLQASGPNADWEICNETSYIMRVATAYIRGGIISPKGWEKARPGECITQKVPINSPRYIYAESDSVHQGGIREWTGSVPLCVSSDNFVADARKSCKLQNLETRII